MTNNNNNIIIIIIITLQIISIKSQPCSSNNIKQKGIRNEAFTCIKQTRQCQKCAYLCLEKKIGMKCKRVCVNNQMETHRCGPRKKLILVKYCLKRTHTVYFNLCGIQFNSYRTPALPSLRVFMTTATTLFPKRLLKV